MVRSSQSQQQAGMILGLFVLLVIVLALSVGWFVAHSMKTGSDRMVPPTEPTQMVGQTQSTPGVQPSEPVPTAPSSLDAGEQDVNVKLNSLDADSKTVDQDMNETVPDLSQ